jgi:NADH-quinone oxidoreductase subunit N
VNPLVSLAAPAGQFKVPEIDYAAVSPMLVVFGAAVVSVLVEAFVARRVRLRIQVVLSLAGLVGALFALVLRPCSCRGPSSCWPYSPC